MSFERFSYKKRDYSPNEKTYDSEIDPYNPTIVEELLQVINLKLSSNALIIT